MGLRERSEPSNSDLQAGREKVGASLIHGHTLLLMRACLGLLLWGLWTPACMRWDTGFWPGAGGNFSHCFYMCWLLMNWYVASKTSVFMNYLQKKSWLLPQGHKAACSGESFVLTEPEMEIRKSQCRNPKVCEWKEFTHTLIAWKETRACVCSPDTCQKAWHCKPQKSMFQVCIKLWLEADALWGHPISYFGNLLLVIACHGISGDLLPLL